MKLTDTSNEINNNTMEKENEFHDFQKSHIGDIDELIFPDDEPYYISER